MTTEDRFNSYHVAIVATKQQMAICLHV